MCYGIIWENSILERSTRTLRAGACQDCPKNNTKTNEAIYTGMSRGKRRKKWDQRTEETEKLLQQFVGCCKGLVFILTDMGIMLLF